MDRTELLFTTDKAKLHKFFSKEPVLYGYHIGDLDDFYFDQCQWAVTYGEKPFIKECVLIYHGGTTPTVLAFGKSDRLVVLLENLLDILPLKFYCHYQNPSERIFESVYKQTPLGRHLKMRLDHPERLDLVNASDSNLIRLDDSHEPALLELYAVSYPGNYFDPHMLATGKYLGWFESGRLAAVAGIHVYSKEYKIAVLGNITTAPELRGRGLATMLTGALCQELHAEGCLVCLNVAADNPAAIKCYERLGFVTVHEYEEGLFETK